jgi:predicted nucleotidyltransferase
MVCEYNMDILSQILSSKVRAAILRHLFGVKVVELHMREIQRVVGCTIGPIQSELKKLLALQLVKARRNGNRLYYSANQEHQLYSDIRSMVLKTSGLGDYLKELFSQLDDIEAAFIFGSIASGEDTVASDIDLMVIGTIGLRALTALLVDFRARIGRELNPHVFTREEFIKRRMDGEHFISKVISSPMLFVKGTDNDLIKMG